jgi:uncharacterized membrane protein
MRSAQSGDDRIDAIQQASPSRPGAVPAMNPGTGLTVEAEAGLVRLTHILYALHGLGLVIGAFGASTVIGAFLFGWPSIIAVIINYIKRADVRGTWLESHFRWQLRTFWYALLWVLLVALVSLPLTFIIVGFVTLAVGLAFLGLWAIYRIARGWLALNDHRPMPMPG